MFDDEGDGNGNGNGSNLIAQHVVDTLINERNPHSIQDQNPNPNLNCCAPEVEKGGDLVQESDDDDDVGPEINNEEVDHAPRGGSRRAQKRRKLRKQKLRLEKKLKREATGNLSDDPDNLHPENVEKEGHLDESKVADNNPNVEKGGDLELVGGVQEEHVEVKQQPKEPQDDQPVPQSVSRKTHKKNKKKKMNARQKAAFEKKLNLVTENLNPIPFAPQRKLDFSIHEQLFKRLGLWEFVNMEFDQNIRSDLIALLLANYNPAAHCSFVNDVRIKLSRADLARALKLPVKKDKSISLETSDFDSEVLSEESISFINEFLSNWILLHDDTWILPNEVLNWDALIKKGQPHKVDWPQFIWYMVEKELKQASEIGTLYFASHIQCLIKSQREDLFKEKPPLEVPVDVEEDFDLEMGSLKDCDRLEFKKLQTELCLGQNASKEEYELEDAMDFEESKLETACQKQWFLDEKSYMTSHVLQRCSTSDIQNQQREHGIEEIEDEEYDDPQPKCSTMGGLASVDIFQEIGTTSITYSPSFRNPGHSSGDPFHSEVDSHFNVGGMSLHVNSFKREAGHDDIEYHNTFSYHHNYKQMKSDVLPPDFNTYIEQIHHLANKAKEMYAEKEKACLNANMNEELVTDLQHRKDTLMDYLRKTRCELQRREMESYKLDGELQLMSNLLEGYRNDLKQNRLAFSKYRERNPEPEEPLYTDAGCGGIVLSTVEFEKQRLVQEEEEKIKRCRIIKQALADFEAGCFENFEGCKARVQQLDKRLFELVEKVKLYSVVVCAKKKMAET